MELWVRSYAAGCLMTRKPMRPIRPLDRSDNKIPQETKNEVVDKC